MAKNIATLFLIFFNFYHLRGIPLASFLVKIASIIPQKTKAGKIKEPQAVRNNGKFEYSLDTMDISMLNKNKKILTPPFTLSPI